MKYVQFDVNFLKEVEEFGYVLGSFTTKDYMFNATEDHEVWVYELNKRTDKERLSRIFKIIDKTGADITGDEKYKFIEYLDQAFDNGMSEDEIEMNILRWQSDEIVYSEMTALFKERRNM